MCVGVCSSRNVTLLSSHRMDQEQENSVHSQTSRITHMAIPSVVSVWWIVRKSNEPSVCHKLLSILWLIEPVCLQTRECQVYQFVPNASISRRYVSILVLILQLIPRPPSWSDDDPSKELRLCITALFFLFANSHNLSTHFCACPSMSQDHATVFTWSFSHPGNFSVAPSRNSWFQHFSVLVYPHFVEDVSICSCSLPCPVDMLAPSQASPIPCPLLLSHPEFSSLEAWASICAPDCSDFLNWTLVPRCDLHNLLVKQILHASLYTRELPQYWQTWFSYESWCSYSLQFPVASLPAFLSPSCTG